MLLILPFIVFEEQYLAQRFCKLSENVILDIFSFFVFTTAFPFELGSRLYDCLLLLRLILHLQRWAVAGHKNEFSSK